MTRHDTGSETVERFYATDGPMATSVMECSADYFEECLLSDRGAVSVWLHSGDVDHVAGTRYLEVERVRVEEHAGVLQIIYLGETLREYPAGGWERWAYANGASDQ